MTTDHAQKVTKFSANIHKNTILGQRATPESSSTGADASETPGERAARLQLLRARQQEQIASETPGERAACLQLLRARQQEQIASETPGERAAHLQLLRARQQEQIASETTGERAALYNS